MPCTGSLSVAASDRLSHGAGRREMRDRTLPAEPNRLHGRCPVVQLQRLVTCGNEHLVNAHHGHTGGMSSEQD